MPRHPSRERMIGDRVKHNAEYLSRSRPRDPNRDGVITGEGYGGTCWYVRWAGAKTPQAIHKDFVSTVSD